MTNPRQIEQCDKCETMYPTIIITCPECNIEVGRAKGYQMSHPARTLCFECYRMLDEYKWKYEELCK